MDNKFQNPNMNQFQNTTGQPAPQQGYPQPYPQQQPVNQPQQQAMNPQQQPVNQPKQQAMNQPQQQPLNRPGVVPPMGQMPPAQARGPQKPPKKPRNPRTKFIVFGILAALGLFFGIIIFRNVNLFIRSTGTFSLPGQPVVDESGSVTASNDDTDDSDSADDMMSMSNVTEMEHEAWDGKSRITCLAMGIDFRDWEANEKYARTDSMMLVTYDPVTERAGMLSIPRDLWVAIPNHDYGRINTAYFLGEAENLPGGGPQLAMETVELFLGVDIQYYAVINFDGFVDFIDAIDKLAIHVKEPITVDPIGPGNTVTLMEGVQDLDGATALAYARHRYTEGGDFERAQRQQDVLYAIYEQLIWQLPKLLANPEKLYSAVTKAVRTNLSIGDMVKLAWTVTDLEPWEISRAVIAPPYQVEMAKTTNGESILVPIPDKIREARDSIFGTSLAGSATLLEEGQDESVLVAKEAAKITLLNGTGNEDLFNRTVQYFQNYGITVVNQGPATNSYANGLEIFTGKPFTGKFLKSVLQVPVEFTKINYDPYSSVDFVVTITDAWANNNPMP